MFVKAYDDEILVKAYLKYHSQNKAAEEIGCSRETVMRAVRRVLDSPDGANMEKVCKYCGKRFEARDRRKIYCSDKCKDIAIRIKNGVRCNTNPEPYHKVCKVCGKPYETFRDNSATCSSECSAKYRNARHVPKIRSKSINNIEARVNAKHGERFEYVSHRRKRIKLKCKICGNVIERAESTVRQKNISCEYCREEKGLIDARQKMMRFFDALIYAKTPRKCEVCGKEFCSPYPTQKYCSETCKIKKNGRSYRSRCRHYGVYYDPTVTYVEVIKRDNGTCKICGKVCDPHDTRWGSIGPDFPTVDHIIPLAKGGTHTWDNVQCVCAICNSYKRDLVDEYANGNGDGRRSAVAVEGTARCSC